MSSTFETNKVNGHVPQTGAESLTSAIDYFTISTPVNLTTLVANGVSALDKLVEIVAQRGQPVILGAVSGSGPYTLRFATEHKGSWNVTGSMTVDNSAVDLASSIVKNGVDFGFDANTTVTLSANV
jgi:hypothetical protein